MVDIKNVKNYKSLFHIIDGKIHELLVIGVIKNTGNIILKGINGNNQSFCPTELFYTKEEIEKPYAEERFCRNAKEQIEFVKTLTKEELTDHFMSLKEEDWWGTDDPKEILKIIKNEIKFYSIYCKKS